jgi:hypothetical protein
MRHVRAAGVRADRSVVVAPGVRARFIEVYLDAQFAKANRQAPVSALRR